MEKAEIQQRHDAREMLAVAKREREEYVKAYTRLQSNVELFVDRTNHELAALALLIKQKDQNIETLTKMANGYMVIPEPAVTAAGEQFKMPEPEGSSSAAQELCGAPPPAGVAIAVTCQLPKGHQPPNMHRARNPNGAQQGQPAGFQWTDPNWKSPAAANGVPLKIVDKPAETQEAKGGEP